MIKFIHIDYKDVANILIDKNTSGKFAIVNLDFYNPVYLSGKKFSQEIPGKDIAVINGDECLHCNICEEKCHYSAIDNRGIYYCVDENSCEGCGLCASMCPADVINMTARTGGKIEITEANNCNLIQVSEIYISFSPQKSIELMFKYLKEKKSDSYTNLYYISGFDKIKNHYLKILLSDKEKV